MDVESRGGPGADISPKSSLSIYPRKIFWPFLETKVDSSTKFTDDLFFSRLPFLRKIVSHIVTFSSFFSFHTILDPSYGPLLENRAPGQPTHLSPPLIGPVCDNWLKRSSKLLGYKLRKVLVKVKNVYPGNWNWVSPLKKVEMTSQQSCLETSSGKW